MIKDTLIRDIRTIFEQEDDYYEPVKVGNFWNNNYVEYESNGNKNKNLLVTKYLDKTKPYLGDIIVDLQESGTKKTQLTIAINFISCKDVNQERVMHLKSNNEEFMIHDNANDIVDKVFQPLLSRYQNNLEIAMRVIGLIFDSHLVDHILILQTR